MASNSKGLWIKRIVLTIFAVLAIGAIIYALQPQPTPVDVAEVVRGDLQVTIAEEGVTRIRDVYEVSAPIGGRIARTDLKVGDQVIKDETRIAEIYPAAPPFLDQRTLEELSAAEEAANAAVSFAEAEIARTHSQLRLARSDLSRAKTLLDRKTVSERAYENAAAEVDMLEAQLTQSLATLNLRRSELASARARLVQPGASKMIAESATCCMDIRAPVNGVVLAIPTESERVVPAGTVLAEIGDPGDLEIVVDLLSADAVKVSTGASARILDWGGSPPLDAVVRRIDPVGFTKVSALGIEEQRVNAVLDITSDTETYARLGHDFRVFIEIVTEDISDATQVPLGALFRENGKWAVFRVIENKVEIVHISLGPRDDQRAIVLDGLAEGNQVVIHPADTLESGGQVIAR